MAKDKKLEELEWLVEIQLMDAYLAPGANSVVGYEEVIAQTPQEAKDRALEQYAVRCKYEPIHRRRMVRAGAQPCHCRAAEAVQIS